MYESPIEMIITDIQHQIVEQQEEQTYKAVVSCIPNINKEELIKALAYDRDQYKKGYRDGIDAAVVHAQWYPESDEEMPNPMFKLVVCSACHKKANRLYIFCPNCGAKMDLDDNAI